MSSDILLAPEAKLVLIVLALCVIVMTLIFATITLVRFEKVGKSAKGRALPTAKPLLTEPDSVSAVTVPTTKPTSFAQPVSAPLPVATFEVSDLEVNPLKAKAGEVVTISAVVTNTSFSPGYYTTELKVNGKLVGMKAFPLAPKTSKLATFEVVENSAGEHKVEVGGLEGKFIIPEADIDVIGLSVSPKRVKEGEAVTAVAEVTNKGGARGSRHLELKLDGVVATTEEVTVAPGANQKVGFTLTKLKPGFHRVEIGNFKDRIMVEMADFFETL